MRLCLCMTGLFIAASFPMLGDHGPGTSGGGVSTQSAETLKPKGFSFDYRFDFTAFDNPSEESIQRKARKAGNFDVLDESYQQTISVNYGIVNNFQIGISIGYYDAKNSRDFEFDSGTGDFEIATFDPDGFTDLWLSAKHRVYRGPLGQIALYGGLKFPTGDSHLDNSAGEEVEQSATAGSGSFDGMLGVAYSTWLTTHLTMDTSVQYIFRTERDEFKVGDRLDAGVALAYRLNEDIQSFPQFSIFGEVLLRHLWPSEEDGAREENSGGTSLFFAPGVRVGFCRNAALTLSPQIPIIQNLRGEQLKTRVKLIAAFNLSF